MSTTVTTAVAESTLPLTSVAVSITVLAPTSLQSKLKMSRDRVILQLSNELLSISVVVILAAPLVSK